MDSARYTTRQEAIERVILPAVNDDSYDVDAIFNEAFAYRVDTDGHGNELLNTAGFEQTVDTDEFWAIVEKHAIGDRGDTRACGLKHPPTGYCA